MLLSTYVLLSGNAGIQSITFMILCPEHPFRLNGIRERLSLLKGVIVPVWRVDQFDSSGISYFARRT